MFLDSGDGIVFVSDFSPWYSEERREFHPDVLAAFRAGHPGLEFVSQGWAGWVNTFVAFDGGNSKQLNSTSGWPSESPLHVMGYRVGKQGIGIVGRHEILRNAFLGELPNVISQAYMNEWG